MIDRAARIWHHPILVATVAAGLAGCDSGGPGPAASPTAESDPSRHARAVEATRAKAASDAEAERKAFQKLGPAAPKL